jgi:hypothetical protein
MTKKTVSLIVVLIVLASLYVYYFTDWVNPPVIQLAAISRPVPSARPNALAYPVTFSLDGRYALTSVKVVSLVAVETNQPLPVFWHLITASNSVPTRGFAYGQPIRGMKPATPNKRALPLLPGIPYRLYVQAGRAKGQIDFTPVALPSRAN